MAKLVEKTYGDALFELAMEKGNLDTYFSQCKDILQAILDNEESFGRLESHTLLQVESPKDVASHRGFFVASQQNLHGR